jgi:hypothetical protein
MDEEEYNAMLRQAIRDRILSEVRSPRDVEKVVNNVYGGPITGSGKNQGLGGGVAGEMAGEDAMSPEDRDYFVDIMRQDLDPNEIDEETQKPYGKGWRKKVHRYTKPKGAQPPHGEPDGDEKKN